MAADYSVHFDPVKQLSYQWKNGQANGKKLYISPVAMGGQAPTDTTGAFRSRPQWNAEKGTWETPINWAPVLSIGAGAGIGAGALSAAGALGGGAAAAPSAGSVAAPAAGVAAAPTTVGGIGPLAVGETFTAGPIAGTGLEGVDLTGMGVAKGSSLLHDLLPSIIGAGASVGGTALAAHANTEAAKIAAAQADKALEIQKEQYALQRQDTAPYRALGQGAVNNLGFLGGIDTQSAVPALSKTVPNVPYGQTTPSAPQTGTLNTLGQSGGSAQSSGLVSVKNPATGLVHLIPSTQVAAAQQAGGQVL